MKTVLFALLIVLLWVGTCFASPFIVSDPYPAASEQPDSFYCTINGVAYTIVYATDAAGLRYLKFDLAGKWRVGTNNFTVKAVNTWGESVTVPFDFIAGVPAAPASVRVIK